MPCFAPRYRGSDGSHLRLVQNETLMPDKICTYKKIKRKFYKFPAGHLIQGTVSTIAKADRLVRLHIIRGATRRTRTYSLVQQSDNLECHLVHQNGAEKVVPFNFGLLCHIAARPEYHEVYAIYPDDLPF